jgi:hypothetical protein
VYPRFSSPVRLPRGANTHQTQQYHQTGQMARFFGSLSILERVEGSVVMVRAGVEWTRSGAPCGRPRPHSRRPLSQAVRSHCKGGGGADAGWGPLRAPWALLLVSTTMGTPSTPSGAPCGPYTGRFFGEIGLGSRRRRITQDLFSIGLPSDSKGMCPKKPPRVSPCGRPGLLSLVPTATEAAMSESEDARQEPHSTSAPPPSLL